MFDSLKRGPKKVFETNNFDPQNLLTSEVRKKYLPPKNTFGGQLGGWFLWKQMSLFCPFFKTIQSVAISQRDMLHMTSNIFFMSNKNAQNKDFHIPS